MKKTSISLKVIRFGDEKYTLIRMNAVQFKYIYFFLLYDGINNMHNTRYPDVKF